MPLAMQNCVVTPTHARKRARACAKQQQPQRPQQLQHDGAVQEAGTAGAEEIAPSQCTTKRQRAEAETTTA